MTTQPTALVTINFDTGNQIQPIAPITFDQTNWNVGRPINVAAIDDLIVEGNHIGTISHVATSEDINYNGLEIFQVTTNITDNDTAGVSINPTDIDATEGGATGSYEVVLTTQPTAEVTINFDTGNQIQPIAPITFDQTNWNVGRPINVAAIDDLIVEGNHIGTISHVATSEDINYNGLEISQVTTNITDNDTAGVSINPTDIDATEGGATGSYEVVLTTQPTAQVTINFDTGNQILPINSITFDDTNWNIPQQIPVAALDDLIAEDNHIGTISHQVISTDESYNAIQASQVTVDITDNDTAAVSITPQQTTVTEDGGLGNYEIVLTTPPTADVTINLNTDDQVQTVPTSINFTPENWNIPQPITISAIDDDILEGGQHLSRIIHQAISDDFNYNLIEISQVTVDITDNDEEIETNPQVIITESDGNTILTAGNSDTYNIVLASSPTTPVDITITPPPQIDIGAGAGIPIIRSFDEENGTTPQTVTVTAVEDVTANFDIFHSGSIDGIGTNLEFFVDGIPTNIVTANVIEIPPGFGSISGIKFQDDNGDGIQNSGEVGIPGFRVYLDINNNNNFETGEPSAITNNDGSYVITGILPEDYILREVQQAGFTQTTPDRNVTVIANQILPNQNFGNAPLVNPGSISGTVFDDLNDNDLLDPGETGLNNVSVNLSGIENDIPIQQTTVTDSSGVYNFSNLLPNIEYTLTAVRSPDLPLQQFPFPVTIPAGESVSNINFAYDVSEQQVPIAENDTASTTANTPITIDVLANDTGESLNIITVDNLTTAGNNATINNNQIIYTPSPGFSGTDTFTYQISDGNNNTPNSSATVNITVTPNQVIPVAENDTASTNANTPITIDVLGNDTGESLNIITVDNLTTAGNNATINNNQIIYTPSPGFSGTDTFTYTIDDGNNNTPNSSATVNITVTPNQVIPVAENDTVSTTANTPITIDVLANDTGESLNIITVDNLTTAGNNATINNNQIIYTPSPGFSGIDTFTYTIDDGNNNTPNSSATVNITVTPNQVIPVAENDTASTNANTPITIDVLANDTGESLNIILVDNLTTAGNNATINNNQIIYTPSPGFSGTDTFTYQISDGNNNTPNSSATVNITVTPNQVIPVAENDTASTNANTPITIDVLANDTGESLNIITVDNLTTAGNNATINNNQIIYTPSPGFSGTDTFTYQISDGNNNTPNSTATVNVTVDSPPSGSISGIIFDDTNQNGFLEPGETALANVTVFIDTNQNGIPDSNEQTTVTNQSGIYTLSNLSPNTYTIRTITPQPDATLITQEFPVTLSSGENLNNIDFGYSIGSPGTLQFSNPTFSVTENEPTATVTVIRTGGNDGVVSANINLSNGTATQGIDYGNPVPETIFFADEETQQTVSIPIINDSSVENTETVNLSLSNVTGGATVGQPATLEIIDDEIISPPSQPFTTRVLGFDNEFNNFDFVRSVQVNPPQGPANIRFSPNTVALVSRNEGGQGRFDGTTNNNTVIAYDIPDQQLGFELDAIVIDLAEVIERIGEIEFGNFSFDYSSPNRSHNVRFFNENSQDIGQGATLSPTISVPGQPNNFSNFSRQGIFIPEDTQFIAIGSESTEIGIDNLQFTLQPKISI
ncbi:MAG: tandem-95 repeat protein [Okeania sp. SIO3B5]|nr:tandem-95 repeat protein [Okeania sp. SIO3B5]